MSIYSLHKKQDKTWRTWIRASGKHLRKNFCQSLNKIREGKSLEKIAKELRVTRKMLSDWTLGNRDIPLWILKILEKKTNLNLKDKIDFLKVYGSQKIKKPVINEEYIEVIGRHCGDGCCSFRNGNYRVNLKEDISLMKQHKKDLKKILGIDTKIRKEQGVYLIDVYSKIFCRIITEIFKVPSEGKKTYIVREPKVIKKLSIDMRKYFLRGLIDTDGWASEKNRTYLIGFKVVSENLTNDVYDLFKLLKFPAKKRIKGNYFQIELVGKNNVKRYLQIVGSKNNRILSRLSLGSVERCPS